MKCYIAIDFIFSAAWQIHRINQIEIPYLMLCAQPFMIARHENISIRIVFTRNMHSIYMQNATNNVEPAVLTRSLKRKKRDVKIKLTYKNVFVCVDDVVGRHTQRMRFNEFVFLFASVKLQSNLCREINLPAYIQLGQPNGFPFIAYTHQAHTIKYFNNKRKIQPYRISITVEMICKAINISIYDIASARPL